MGIAVGPLHGLPTGFVATNVRKALERTAMSPKPTVIFDLDGTLVESDGFDGALYVEAVREVLGQVEIDESWRRYRHVTDAGVLAQIVEEAGLPDADRANARVRAVFGAKVRGYLAEGGRCECVPGARAAIADLLAAGYGVGIATGGWGHTARAKLAHVGIALENLAFTSSDDGFDRVAIMTACLHRLGGTPDTAVYVGDGHWDLEASRRAGWGFIGVGSKLRGACQHWIANFADSNWPLAYTEALRGSPPRGIVGG